MSKQGVRRVTLQMAAEMRRLVEEGRTAKDVARIFGIAPGTARRYTSNAHRPRSQCTRGRAGMRGPDDPQREARLIRAVQVEPLTVVAAREGISRPRLGQIVAAWQKRTGRQINGPQRSAPKTRARVPVPAPSLPQMLLAKALLRPATGCWEWRGSVVALPGARPQPRSSTAKKRGFSQVVPIAAFQLWRNPEIGRRFIDPVVCGNPLCINPFH